MKVKIGAIITDASGSLGGHVLGTNRGTMVLKNKSVSKKPPTPAQSVYRSRTNFLMSKWSSLTDDQRRLWYLQIKDYKQTDIFNTIKTLNGFTLFQKLNQGLMLCNLPALNTPAETHKPTPSNNLIISCSTTALTVQSDFYNSTDEVTIYASGTLNSGITKPKKFMRLITILNGATLQTTTDITNAYENVFGSITDTSRFFIANQTFSNLTGFSNGVLTINTNAIVPDIPTNIVAHWNFNDNVLDSVSGLDGTIIGSPTYVTGLNGKALSFNGSTDYVTIPYNSILALTTFTINAVVYFDTSFQAGFNILFEFNRYNNNWYALSESNSGDQFRGLTPGGGKNFDTTIYANNWYMATFSYNQSQMKFYQNGVLVKTINRSNALSTQSSIATIGANNSGNEKAKVIIDDMRVYDIELNATEIMDLYNSLT